jgi:hypothetical protein
MDRETFVVQSAKESFHFSVRLRMPRTRPPVCDAQAPAGLLEAGLSLCMKRIAHGKDQVVVSHHRFDPVRQFGYELFQECCGIATPAIGTNLREGFAGEVVHRSESILPLRVFPAIEVFQIQVHQRAGPALSIAAEDFSLRHTQTIASMEQQDAMHAAVADAQGQCNTHWAPAPLSQFQDWSADIMRQPARRVAGPTRAGLEPRSPLLLVARPPARKYRAGNARLSAQHRQRFSLLVHFHQQFPFRNNMSHSTHAPPPGGSSYRV